MLYLADRLQAALTGAVPSNDLLELLRELEDGHPPRRAILKATAIGRVLHRFARAKHALSPRAQPLLQRWREAAEAESKQARSQHRPQPVLPQPPSQSSLLQYVVKYCSKSDHSQARGSKRKWRQLVVMSDSEEADSGDAEL